MSALDKLAEFCRERAKEHVAARQSEECVGDPVAYGYADGSEDAYINVTRFINELQEAGE